MKKLKSIRTYLGQTAARLTASPPAAPTGKDGPQTHLNPFLSNRLKVAKEHFDGARDDPEYTATRSKFDTLLYLIRRRDMMRSTKTDVIGHYIKAGQRENRIPSAYFSPNLYLERYPEVAEQELNPFAYWLTQGRAQGQIAYPIAAFDDLCNVLGMVPAQAQDHLIDIHESVRERLVHGKLGEMVAKAARLEPLIEQSWPAALEPKIAPFHSDGVAGRIVALDRLQSGAQHRRARYVLVTDQAGPADMQKMALHITNALISLGTAPDDLLVITTASNDTAARHIAADTPFADGVRVVDFAAATRDVGPKHTLRLMAEFLRSLRPGATINLGSDTLWDTVHSYGAALDHSFRLIHCLTGREQSDLGFQTGAVLTRFYRSFDQSTSFGVTSPQLAQDVLDRFLIPPDQRHKVVVLRPPVNRDIPLRDAPDLPSRRRPQIYWAGRLGRQTGADLLFAIAAALPDFDFRIWGDVDKGSIAPLPPKPDNLTLEGQITSIADLDLTRADAWLHTARWDGVGADLLEVAMAGVPLVASRIGGGADTLTDGPDHPVDDPENPAAYIAALQGVIRNPTDARERAIALRAHLLDTRTETAFRAQVSALLDPKTAP